MKTTYPQKPAPATDTTPPVKADPFDIERARERQQATTPAAQRALRRKRLAELEQKP